MVPVSLAAGFLLGWWIRWWAIPIVAIAWLVFELFHNPGGAFGGAVLSACNAFLAVMATLGLRYWRANRATA